MATTTYFAFHDPPAAAVSASSSATGTRAQDLLSADGDAARRDVTWASDGEAVGAWLSLTWSRPTTVDSVRLRAAGSAAQAVRSTLLTFDDGASLLVTADPDGDTEVTFPERRTSTVRLTVAEAAPGAESVALTAVSVDDRGGDDAEPLGAATPTRVSTSSGASAAAGLQDGDAATGDTGGEWRADPTDASPWVRASWSRPVEVSSVQVLGPSTAAVDPTFPATAALSGLLRFDDGSQVVVTGIAGGGVQPTTIAFAPRVTSSVRLELTRSVPTAAVALQEFRVLGPGTTPPRWSTGAAGQVVDPPPARCDTGDGTAAAAPGTGLVLLCPTPGSVASGPTTIVVGAVPGTALEASAPVVGGAGTTPTVRPVARGTAGPDGRAELTLDTGKLPAGPVTVQVRVEERDDVAALPVQLLNRGGRAIASPGFAPDGATLQWQDDFDEPLSISATGQDADYAAAKPVSTGTQSFGDAAFADPADGAGTVATVDGYLRLRAEPTAGRSGATDYGQEYLGGMASSARMGGSGFAAQYGYYEARMTGAPGPGSWPAFWTMNTQSTTRDDAVGGEADVVELYGHNAVGSCHSLHRYDRAVGDGEEGDGYCPEDNGFSDWTTTWHTYGMRVVPNGAVFFIDGVQVADLKGLGRYDEPFYFMLDLALGGGWPVDLSPTGGTTDLYVDWVRVYT